MRALQIDPVGSFPGKAFFLAWVIDIYIILRSVYAILQLCVCAAGQKQLVGETGSVQRLIH